MSDWIPWIAGSPILFFGSGLWICFGMIAEGIPWEVRLELEFFIVAYVAYDFFIGYEQPIIKLF